MDIGQIDNIRKEMKMSKLPYPYNLTKRELASKIYDYNTKLQMITAPSKESKDRFINACLNGDVSMGFLNKEDLIKWYSNLREQYNITKIW